MTRKAQDLQGRSGECQACGETFFFPSTGPLRIYCLDRRCKERRHARACWTTYAKRVEREAAQLGIVIGFNLFGEEEVELPINVLRRSGSQSFSERFRGADQAALFYEIILLGDPCAYCGVAPIGFPGPDHIEPFHIGGGGEWENLTAACRECNSSKSSASLLLWLLESSRLNGLRAQKLQLSLFE